MRWVVCAWTLLGCGRIGFDEQGDGPPGAVDLDFRSCAVPTGVAFARSSPATLFDATGTLQTAAPGQPRCSYDPSGMKRGLLVEGAAINYNTVARGEGMDAENFPLGWQSQHSSMVTVNATVADSTTFLGMREVTITPTNNDNVGQYWQVLIGGDVPRGGAYTMSWYARSSDPAAILACYLFAVLFTPGLQMQIGRTAESPDELPTAAWKRFVYTINTPANTGHIQMYFECVGEATSSYTITLAAPQLEAGPLATTTIPTSGAQGMRAADIVTLPTSRLDIDASGTVIVDVAVDAEATGTRRIALASGDTAATTVFRLAHDATGWNAFNGTSGAGVQAAAVGAHRVGYRFAPDAGTFVVDGATSVSLGADALAGSVTALGADHDGVDSLNGTLARVRAWPDALDDATLVDVSQ